jgi:D-arabinose 1-dehydrogenase-like Zn-dependent alcohol dehydrogenase
MLMRSRRGLTGISLPAADSPPQPRRGRFRRGPIDAVIDCVASRETLEAGVRVLARAGRLVIIGSRPADVFGVDSTFRVDPQWVLHRGLEIHGSRYVSLAELAQTLELLRQRRIRAIVTREFRLEEAEEAHRLLRQNALVGRAALIQT